jgi:hypothetical protein
MANARNLSTLAQGASTAGILSGTYGGTGANLTPTTAGNVIFTADGSVWSSTAKIVQTSQQASTSGSTVTFGSIPSWVKRITMMLNGVSTDTATSAFSIQLGTSGGIVSTGYNSSSGSISTGQAAGANGLTTTGFVIGNMNAIADLFSGIVTIANFSSNTWACTSVTNRTGAVPVTGYSSGTPIALGGVLTQVRLTISAGAFDAGSVNILYE